MRCTQAQRSAHLLARRVGLGNQPLVRINQARQVFDRLRIHIGPLQPAAFLAPSHVANHPAHAGATQQRAAKSQHTQQFLKGGHAAAPMQVLYSPWRRAVNPRSGSSWPVLGLRYLSYCKMRRHASA